MTTRIEQTVYYRIHMYKAFYNKHINMWKYNAN